MERTIFALFDDALAALGVARALEREGYDRDSISLLVPDPRGRYGRAPDTDAPRARIFQPVEFPGLGAAAITGPFAPVLARETGARGGLVEALTALGLVEPAARHYFESIRRGQAIVTLELSGEGVRRAVELMRKFGARAVDDVETAAPAPPEPPLSEPPLAAAEPALVPDPDPEPAPATGAALRDEVRVPVVEEQLEIGKRQIARGGVRVHSHIVEEPVEQEVSLREERVRVERRPAYRDATDEDLADFQEGSIEFHETIEEPVIVKRRRVVEEIVIGKETRERTARISETLRKAQVSVEQLRSVEEPDDPGTGV